MFKFAKENKISESLISLKVRRRYLWICSSSYRTIPWRRNKKIHFSFSKRWFIRAITVYYLSQTLFWSGTSCQEVVETIGNALTQKRSDQDKTHIPGITRRISQTVKTHLAMVQDTTVNEMRKLRILFGKLQTAISQTNRKWFHWSFLSFGPWAVHLYHSVGSDQIAVRSSQMHKNVPAAISWLFINYP